MKHRRLLAAFMSICMVASLVPVGAMTAFGDELRAAATGAYGDADGNGVVDLRDVLLVEQHFAGEDTPSLVLERADVNLDGVADLADADAIREYLVNVRPTLQPTSCTVSFDTQGGDPLEPLSAVEGFTISETLPTPDKAGAFFTQWQLDGQPFYQDDYVLTGDIELVAAYEGMEAQEALLVDSFTVNDVRPDHTFGITGGASAAAVLAGVSLTPKDGSDPLALVATEAGGGFAVAQRGDSTPAACTSCGCSTMPWALRARTRACAWSASPCTRTSATT